VVVVAVLLAYSLSHLNLGAGPVPLTPPSSYGIDIALSPDGSRAYVTEPSDNRLAVLDAHTGEQLATVAVGDDPSGLALSPDGTQLWVVNTALSLEASGSVTVIATATDSVLGTVPVGPDPIDLAFSPNGRWAYVTNNGVISPGTVNVIDTSTLAVIGTIGPLAPPSPASWGWNPTSVAVTPDGRQLWVSEVDNLEDSSTSTDFVYVFDATFGGQEARIPVGAGPYFMVLSRDGREAYVADKLSCDVLEIDTATFRVVATVRWPSGHGSPFGLATRSPEVTTPSTNLVPADRSVRSTSPPPRLSSPAPWAPTP
jgi:YVTN family beta-propeller protein